MSTVSQDAAWFREAAFGMFIHWGVYAVPGRGEWVMNQEQIPAEEYAGLAKKFKPRRFDPDAWAAIARDAGMRYMVLTTRHHDGYSLFDSKVSDFTSVKTAARRDFVAEYVAACRRAGLKVGLYYSLGDWRWPVTYEGQERDPAGWQKLVDYVHSQVTELCTNYGKIDLLWYDGGFCGDGKGNWLPDGPNHYDGVKLNAMVHRLQPGILINNRAGDPADFDTPEQHITPSPAGRLWEACMTMNCHWGFFKDDNIWKPPRQIILHLLTACACGGGNLLLNVGPKPDGTIPSESVKRLKIIGQWLKVNGEAIYGVKPAPFGGASFGVTTAKDNHIYLIVHWWPGTTLRVPDVDVEIKEALMLATGQPLPFTKNGRTLWFHNLPRRAPDPMCTVIKLTV